MKISLQWLNMYLEPSVGAEQVEAVLPRLGFPIEASSRVEGSTPDCVLDIEVTSNRGDCLSHIGMAREVAAGCGKGSGRDAGLRLPPEAKIPDPEGGVGELVSVAVDAPQACDLYTARVVRGVRVGPSPSWLVQRLEAVGLRSVNNVVDVTNYVLHDRGQPLHAFDLARLQGPDIVVRFARQGELFVAIDGSHHTLAASNLVIADAERPVAVAGVMGGLDTEVGQGTTDILLEAAVFDPLSVRRTSRALKLASDSSFRFERAVDPLGVDEASRRAVELICEVAGGRPCDGVLVVGRAEVAGRVVTMRLARCRSILGVDLAPRSIQNMLARLALDPTLDKCEGIVRCRIPSFRLDLQREIDLIEEVVRLHGMDAIGVRDRIAVEAVPPQPSVEARRTLASVLVAYGFHEAVTFTFISPELGTPFLGPDCSAIEVDEACRRVGTRAEPMLRPSLLPSLLACRKSNQDVGNTHVKLYEMAATWHRCEGRKVEQRCLGLLVDVGGVDNDPAACEAAIRSVRGAVDEMLERVGAGSPSTLSPAGMPGFDVAAEVSAGGQRLGRIGSIDAPTRARFGLQAGVVVAELDLDALVGFYPPSLTINPLARYPAIERDLSIVVDENTAWRKVEQVVFETGAAWFESLHYLSVYRGKQVPPGRKSVSLRMVFRDPGQTLRHEAVDREVEKVVESLTRNLEAVLR